MAVTMKPRARLQRCPIGYWAARGRSLPGLLWDMYKYEGQVYSECVSCILTRVYEIIWQTEKSKRAQEVYHILLKKLAPPLRALLRSQYADQVSDACRILDRLGI